MLIVDKRKTVILQKGLWQVIYYFWVTGPDWDVVTVSRSNGKRAVSTMELNRELAREHYSRMQQDGYRRLDF